MSRLMNEAESKAWNFFYHNCIGDLYAEINYQFDSSELATLVSINNQEVTEPETINSMMEYIGFDKKIISKDNYHYGVLFSKKRKDIKNMNSNTLKTIDLFLNCKAKYRQSAELTALKAVHQARLTISNPTVEQITSIFEAFEKETENIPYYISAETLANHISAWAKMNIPAEAVSERLEFLQIEYQKIKGVKMYAIQLDNRTDLNDKWFLKFIE